jgi:molecular chaperone GrpE
VANPPPNDDATDFELAVDDDLLAAAVAAVEARMAPKPPPEPDPEEEAEFAADLEVELDGVGFEDEDEDGLDDAEDDGGIDLLVDEDEEDGAPASMDGTLDVLLAELTRARSALAESESRAESLEAELVETADALAAETQERRRATAIAVRLKERAQRSDLLVTNARNGRAAAEKRITELEEAIEHMEAERARIRDRRRKELDEARQHGLAPTLKELLPVLDHLEMAVAHGGSDPDKLREGVGMIVGQFQRALGTQGVARVEASPGTPFDPERHEALQRVETDAQPEGTVLAEVRAGFLLNGRLLRAARVTVAAAPPAPPAPAPEPEPEPAAEAEPEAAEPPAPAEAPDAADAAWDATLAAADADDAGAPGDEPESAHAADEAPEQDADPSEAVDSASPEPDDPEPA